LPPKSKPFNQKIKNKKMKQAIVTRSSFFRNISLAVLSLSLVFTSCSKNNDKVVGSEFVGSYAVQEDDDAYTIAIESKGGNKYQIKNFGGFMYVPIEANAVGSQLNIPSQTFKNSSGFEITITGTGSLTTKSKKDDTIKFNYSVSGSANYDSEFEGTRN
jgi:hypothetical protein